MLVMRTLEGRANTLSRFPCGNQAIGFHHSALAAYTRFASMGLSHGLVFDANTLKVGEYMTRWLSDSVRGTGLNLRPRWRTVPMMLVVGKPGKAKMCRVAQSG